MGRKLILINPVYPYRTGLSVNPGGRFPPLGLGVVAALTRGDWDIKILDENFETFRYEEADLVGISCFTSQIIRAYEIASIYRERGIPTVIGGIHASMLPEEALKYADTVVIGEAERTWPILIEDFEKGKLRRIYRGDGTSGTRISGARHDLFHPKYLFGSIQTARGCPMDCNFCSVTTFNGGQYRQRDIEDVLDELETIRQPYVYFVDDNLYGYGKHAAKRAIALFEGIVERGIQKQWFSQSSINFADSETVVARAAKSGCRMILLGIEAESDNALQDAGKKLNIKFLDRFETVFHRINSHGIAVLGSFIYGMEHDTIESMRARTKYILDSEIGAIQISLMTPLPGTRLFKQLQDQGRLLYTDFPNDWTHYDMTEVMFKPLMMTPEELYEGFCEAGMTLYNHATLLYKYIDTLRITRNLTTAVWAYRANLNYHNAAMGLYLQRSWPLFS
jgi:radical SAM superfamily enzyme YgiQ (UPF0313 family)